MFAWLVGIGSPGRRRHLDRRPHRPVRRRRRRKRERQPPRDHRRRPHAGRASRSPSPTRGSSLTSGAHRRRPQGREARRAPGGRPVRCSPSCRAILFLVSYFVFKIGDETDTIGGLGASNLALGLTLAVALLAMGAGIIQWARKLMGDHEIVEMRHTASSSRGGPRGDRRHPQDRARGVGSRTPPPDPQLAAGRRRHPRDRADRDAARPRSAAGRQARPHGLGPQHLDPRDAGLVGDPGPHLPAGRPRRRRYADQGRPTSRSATWSTPSPRCCSPPTSDGQPLVEGTELLVAKAKAAVILHRMVPERDRVGGRP